MSEVTTSGIVLESPDLSQAESFIGRRITFSYTRETGPRLGGSHQKVDVTVDAVEIKPDGLLTMKLFASTLEAADLLYIGFHSDYRKWVGVRYGRLNRHPLVPGTLTLS